MDTPLTLLVTYTCRPGMARAFVEAVRTAGIQDAVRREDGCLRYDYFLSLEAEDTVLLLERWASAGAQAIHMTQPHMAHLAALKLQYVADTRAERLP